MPASTAPPSARDFEREHQRLFGHIQPGGSIEITKLRVQAFGQIPRLEKVDAKRATGDARPIERRRVWIDALTGWTETPVYDGASLMPATSSSDRR